MVVAGIVCLAWAKNTFHATCNAGSFGSACTRLPSPGSVKSREETAVWAEVLKKCYKTGVYGESLLRTFA